MKSFLIVGNTGTGKTTFVKTALKKSKAPLFLYDVNNEYKEFQNLSEFGSFEDFLQEVKNKTGAVIVFEEATIFFSNRGASKEATEILVRKRHTGNLIFFVFHSLRTVPLHIFDLCDFLILHKTADNIKLMEAKFNGNDKILNSFFECLKSVNKYERKILSLR